ncbi:long-chain-fatty-acid--CoA ligase [Desulfoluna spongiiphila]|uniref:Long-chain acyl-CoA synthetase n=1 Tax=Desulfoluna spongiiphila TaxID=419481 RepID=A0A1G5E7H6_9BACT|nr:long-chain fatty acid--CoA ligase [Desulfoluna spongiiphila]SCY22468.1 long-chain acyl-CoA synthetase [Desulfoluna spongiiphila]VVS91614.1 amp-dependent synthetase/ligase [Desulfoluna spongiiphila]
MTSKVTYQSKPWLSSYETGVPESLEFENIFIAEFLERSVRRFPDNTALVFQGFRVSYREFDTMVGSMVACLRGMGIKKGDSVAILLPNVIPCVVAYYAIMRLGAVAVMNNPLYTDRELTHQFNDSGAVMLITLDLLADRMVALREKTGIKTIIYTSIGDYLPFPKNLFFPLVAKRKKMAASVTPAPDLYKWKEVLASHAPSDFREELHWDDVAMYQYTGGTTGVSKGVMLTHRNLSCQVQQLTSWFSGLVDGEEIFIGGLPFFHIFGLTTTLNFPIAMGAAIVLVPKPQGAQLLEAIRKFRPTFSPLVPTMYISMMHDPAIEKTDLSCIKGLFSGSAPLPVEVIREFERRSGAVIAEGFGMTESCPVTHINPFDGGPRKAGSIGVPISNTEARIVDLADGVTEMPVGQVGELVIRGPQVMKGYLNNPGATQEALAGDWLHTGDIAKMDEDGYFYIVDRKKDMIISGGYNVYPRDIDEVLHEHPKVQDACSIGVPHAHRGEAVKAFVVLKDGESATEQELIDFCSGKLAKYKWPVSVEFRGELPRSTVGKILRKDLREETLGGGSRDDEE